MAREPSDLTSSTKPFKSGFVSGMALGILMIFIGFIVIGSAWQFTDVDTGNAGVSVIVVVVGGVFAFVGQLLFIVYAIAQAVYMGVSRASDREAHLLGD